MRDLRDLLRLFAVVGLAIFAGVAGCSNDKGDRIAEKAAPRDPVISRPAKPNGVAEEAGVAEKAETPKEIRGQAKSIQEPVLAKPPGAVPKLARQSVEPETGPSAALAKKPMPKLEPPQPTANQPSAAMPQAIPEADDSEPLFLDRLPAGATRRQADRFSTVKVFYGTDRKCRSTSTQANATIPSTSLASLLFMIGAIILLIARKIKFAVVAAALAVTICIGLFLFPVSGSIEKSGVDYSGARGEFVRGLATVTVPDKHQRGVVERPSILKFELSEDQEKHIVLTSAVELDSDDFYDQLSGLVRQSSEQDMLVFIHGYNVDFESALQRTAQIAVDLPFRGVPVCYSWPSQGSIVGYTVDENNVTWTIPHLRDFLLELTQRSGATSINVVAHSMGNRAMASAMGQISLQVEKEREPLFDRVVLAAPDIDADYFRNDLGPQLARVGRNITLYASSDDQALVASRHLHGGYPRAGESGEQLVVVPNIETIDVSGVDLSLLGHSYYSGSEFILRDLYDVVRNRLTASQRASLIARPLGDTTYWLLRQPQVSELPVAPLR